MESFKVFFELGDNYQKFASLFVCRHKERLNYSNTMVISPQKVVSLTYQLRLESHDGDLVEEVGKDQPLSFLFGVGQMIPAFETELEGKKVGDTWSFQIASDEAYGEVDDDAVVQIPREVFQVDGEIQEDLLVEGNTIPMQDPDGNSLSGTVVEVSEDMVTMDFNHPLAGEDLFFTVEITGIREATPTELAHGHVHGHDGHDEH